MGRVEKFFVLLFFGFIAFALYSCATLISDSVRTILVFAGIH